MLLNSKWVSPVFVAVTLILPSSIWAQRGTTQSPNVVKENNEKADKRDQEKAAESVQAPPHSASSPKGPSLPALAPTPSSNSKPDSTVRETKSLVDALKDQPSCSLPSGGHSVSALAQKANQLEQQIGSTIDIDGNPLNNVIETSALDQSPEGHQHVNNFVLEKMNETAEQISGILNGKLEHASKQVDSLIEKISPEEKQGLRESFDSLLKEYSDAKSSGNPETFKRLEAKLHNFLWQLGGRPALAALGLSEEELQSLEKECAVKFGWKKS